ncbi:MAG: T9SS type A sorting domain-containing protein [Bacteroidales bacterium]|nr:T9SS type A sorting domain-containing protein [Bacteroidales bacterium]MBN2820049.1 T9SS type A sorting domain-containing protein [Bacteroidales bacterium]
MKNNILILLFLFVGIVLSAQETDYVPVNTNGIEQIIVEKFDASAVGTDYVTYKVYVDLETAAKYQLFIADEPNGPMNFSTTGSWYNTTLFGGTIGEDIDIAGSLGFTDLIIYDSYVTSGGAGVGRIGVTGGSNPGDGWVAGTPANSVTTPGLVLSMFGTASSTVNFDIVDGAFTFDPADETATNVSATGGRRGVIGATAANEVLIGQFTTNGDFSFSINLQTITSAYAVAQTSGITYSSIPNTPPTVSISAPANATTVNKNEIVGIAATASDTDGSVNQVEFFVNGLSVGSDNAAPFTASWEALGTSAEIYAIATDNQGATSQSASVTINVNDPNPTLVSVTAPTASELLDLNDFLLTANASDADQPVQSVDFIIDGIVIGTDTDGTDGWSFLLQNIAASGITLGSPVNVVARATNSDSEMVASAAVSATWENASPSLAISNPASFPFDLSLGDVLTITADASDVDGSITSVDFLINGTVVSTDNDGTDGFSYNYSAGSTGSVSVSVRATDNSGAQVTVAGGTINNLYAGAEYLLESVTEYCSSSDVFCMPVITPAGGVSGIIGYDIELVFDPSKVTPTGAIIVSEELIADRDWTSYNYNVVDSLVRASIYFNGSAPQGTSWNGEGQVFCVEFSRNFDFGNVDQAEFNLRLVTESRAAGITDIPSTATSTYQTITETEFNGKLSFWSDNSAIAYENGVNLITNIYGNVSGDAISVQPDAAGNFTYNTANGTSISIDRDVDASVDVQSTIGAYDAYLASRVAVEDVSFSPNVFQIIAMDVNRDGRIAAGDITQISQRAVGQLDQFAADWVWVPNRTRLSDLQYRISAAYPVADGIGYSRLNVPVPADVMALPIEDPDGCPAIQTEEYKGILLGDVTGNYADAPASPAFKSAATADITLYVNETSIIVKANSGNAIDLQLGVKNATEVSTSLQGAANIAGDVVKLALFGNSEFNDTKVANILLSEGINPADIEIISASLNEVESEVEITAEASSAVNSITTNAALIYPNPAKNEIKVEFEGVADVALVSITGQVVSIERDVNGHTSFDVSELPAGNYTVIVGTQSYKVVVVE